jgi:predicted nucleotidyltransferase
LQQRLRILREKLPLTRAVLFGSYAKGRHTIASDIDLLLVYAGENRPDAYALVKRTLHLPRLEPHLYTEMEYERVKDMVERMTRGGVSLAISDE